MRLLVLIVVSIVASGCGPRCRAYAAAPVTTCVVADAGRPGAGQPLVIEGTMFGGNAGNTGACSVDFDGGTLTFTMTGTMCDGAPQTNPVVFPVTTRCPTPPMPAGEVLFSNSGDRFVFTDGGVSLADGGALPACF